MANSEIFWNFLNEAGTASIALYVQKKMPTASTLQTIIIAGAIGAAIMAAVGMAVEPPEQFEGFSSYRRRRRARRTRR